MNTSTPSDGSRLEARPSSSPCRRRGLAFWIGALLLASSATAAPVVRDVTDFGANGTDTLDDTDAIQRAINSGDHIRFPNGIYFISRNLIANASTSTQLVASSTFQATIRYTGTGLRTLQLYKFNWVSRLIFDGVNIRVMGDGAQNARMISENIFKNIPRYPEVPNEISYGINLRSWDANLVRNVKIHANRFHGSYYGVEGGAVDTTITNNTIDECEYGVAVALDDSVIKSNVISKGRVGIFMPATSYALPTASNNVIENNTVSDPADEGISIDARANEPISYSRWTSTTYAYDIVGGVATGLFLNSYPASPQGLVGHHVVFLSDGKPTKGLACEITAVTWNSYHGKYRLQISDGPAYAACEKGLRVVVLAKLAQLNVIRNNTVRRAGTGIMLWGAGRLTTIIGNRVENCRYACIEVVHLSGAEDAPGKECPAFYNVVKNNVLVSNGAMHRSPLGFWEKRYFASPAYKAIGNDEDNNTHNGALVSASNGLLWLNQEE